MTTQARTLQNRGLDSYGRPSLTLELSTGKPQKITPPHSLLTGAEQSAWLQGFAAAVKLLRESD